MRKYKKLANLEEKIHNALYLPSKSALLLRTASPKAEPSLLQATPNIRSFWSIPYVKN